MQNATKNAKITVRVERVRTKPEKCRRATRNSSSNRGTWEKFRTGISAAVNRRTNRKERDKSLTFVEQPLDVDENVGKRGQLLPILEKLRQIVGDALGRSGRRVADVAHLGSKGRRCGSVSVAAAVRVTNSRPLNYNYIWTPRSSVSGNARKKNKRNRHRRLPVRSTDATRRQLNGARLTAPSSEFAPPSYLSFCARARGARSTWLCALCICHIWLRRCLNFHPVRKWGFAGFIRALESYRSFDKVITFNIARFSGAPSRQTKRVCYVSDSHNNTVFYCFAPTINVGQSKHA